MLLADRAHFQIDGLMCALDFHSIVIVKLLLPLSLSLCQHKELLNLILLILNSEPLDVIFFLLFRPLLLLHSIFIPHFFDLHSEYTLYVELTSYLNAHIFFLVSFPFLLSFYSLCLMYPAVMTIKSSYVKIGN